MNKLLSVKEVAERENLDKTRILQLIKEGRVSPAPVKVGSQWVIDADYKITNPGRQNYKFDFEEKEKKSSVPGNKYSVSKCLDSGMYGDTEYMLSLCKNGRNIEDLEQLIFDPSPLFNTYLASKDGQNWRLVRASWPVDGYCFEVSKDFKKFLIMYANLLRKGEINHKNLNSTVAVIFEYFLSKLKK